MRTKGSIEILEKYTDEQLIDKIKKPYSKKKNEALLELKTRHIALIHSTYNKYQAVVRNLSQNFDDVIPNVELLIYQTALSFNNKKGSKYSSWLANHTRYCALNAINKRKEIATDETQINKIREKSVKNHRSKITTENTLDYIKFLVSEYQDERLKKMIELRFFSGDGKKSWKEVSKELKISSQCCINIFRKFVKLAKNKLTTSYICDII